MGATNNILIHYCSAVEQFIRAKYERKQYIAKDGNSQSSTSKPVVRDTQEHKSKNKPKKASSSSTIQKPQNDQVR